MSLRRAFAVSIALLVMALLWLLWPYYWFEAHKGKVPFLPFGWETIDGDAPLVQETFDPRYEAAGSRVLALISQGRVSVGAPGISAAVSIDGEVVWRGAAGWADLKSNSPATPETVFRIGSTSKAITATALARLVDKGDIDLDAPISVYLSDVPNPEWIDITPRQLASHMAGLPHYKENRDWKGLYHTIALRAFYGDVREAVDVFDESPLLYSPGTDFHYSSFGTVLLAAVMSEAVGKPYRQIVQEEVFGPAGMTSTIVAPRLPDGHPHLASFYYSEDQRYREWRPVDLSHRLPGGGFASTPTDLVRMGAVWLDATYIPEATRDAFWTPQTLSNGEVNEQGYAMGWRWREWDVEGVGIARNANHGGVSRGAQSWLLVFPDYAMAIALSINTTTDQFHEFGMLYEDIFREFALAKKRSNREI